jgi:hypothetical protein
LGELESRAIATGLERAFEHKARTADVTMFQQSAGSRE